ncbi:MAG: nucleoside hydrolase [Herbiconiux sp.]|nr:nucleoside hydrolase [Herbiconiux sp.]
MTSIPVLLDVDTGLDDAMAILFAVAHPDVELIGITCVAGNTSLENVVANTLKVLDVAEAPEVPVAAGSRRPLIEPARASHVHGGDGLGDLGLPPSRRVADPRHAVDLARDLLLAAPEPVTVVALAPQTNLALLLRQHPEVVPKIARVLFMGGSASGGNATAMAEFNVWHDPEAAAIVIDSGVPTFMYGLDVFNQVVIDETDADRLAAGDSASGRLTAALLRAQLADDADGLPDPDGYAGHIGDAGALCALVDPGALQVERHPVRVELAGSARGQTIVDRRRRIGEDTVHGDGPGATRPVPIDVALDVDAPRYARLFLDTIARLP